VSARIFLSFALAAGAAGCGDADVFVPLPEFGGPAGVITGGLTYAGPPPCTAGGHVRGAAVLLGFEENLLPPPQGLGTRPVALTIVSGDDLFRGIRSELGFAPDGALVCPAPDAPPVAVSVEYAVGPLTAGVYEIRGFYDIDGDFNPGFSIFNLPTAGDIGGGAIVNAEEVLGGAAAEFRRIPIGDLQPDGQRVMPPTGALVEGVATTLGLTLPLERPIFHIAEVRDEAFGNDDPAHIVVPADYQLNVFSIADPPGTEASFVRLFLGAGVPEGEAFPAAANPFFFPTSDPILLHTRQDVNLDGVIDGNDHIPETAILPALLPLGLLTRIADTSDLTSQRPNVILQGVTILDGLLETVSAPVDLAEARREAQIALRPAVLCIDPADKTKPGLLVNTHETDKQGNVLVADPAELEAALSAQFLRPVHVVTGCLPEGRYNVNLVYDTGQAWTVPNEAGVCGSGEALSADGLTCGQRPRLVSQAAVVTIGPPDDAGYCAEHPTPVECQAIE
jgi:hypothetical protein